MAAISAAGLSLGIDGSSMIKQLVAIKTQPLQDIRSQQSEVGLQVSAYGRLKSAVSAFQSVMSELASPLDNAFINFSATSSNEDAFTASAGSTAASGSYSVEVIGLAAAKKQASSAYVDSSTDIGGSGSIDITVDGVTSNVAVAAGSTLADVRDAINQAADNPGVSATILNEAGGSRLILTSTKTGVVNEFTLSINDDDFNSTDNNGLSKIFFEDADPLVLTDSSVITAAADAQIKIDGFTVNSATNKVTGAIDGLTIDAVTVGTGTLTVARDDGAIQEAVEKFVSAYNDLKGSIDTLYEGDLDGDSSLRFIQQNMMGVLNATSVTDTYSSISQVGVTRDEDGVLSLDASALTDALNNDMDSVAALFSDSTDGITVRMETFADQLLGFDGMLVSREEGLNSRLSSLEEQENRWEIRALEIEARYQKQFAAMDAAVSSMQASSSFLAA